MACKSLVACDILTVRAYSDYFYGGDIVYWLYLHNVAACINRWRLATENARRQCCDDTDRGVGATARKTE